MRIVQGIALGGVAVGAAAVASVRTATSPTTSDTDGSVRTGHVLARAGLLAGASGTAIAGALALRRLAPGNPATGAISMVALGGAAALLGGAAGTASTLTSPGQFAAGAGEAAVDELTSLHRVPIAKPTLPFLYEGGHYQGAIWDPRGASQRSGFRAMDGLLQRAHLVRDAATDAGEPAGAALATTTHAARVGDGPAVLTFHADAAGASWLQAGQESAMAQGSSTGATSPTWRSSTNATSPTPSTSAPCPPASTTSSCAPRRRPAAGCRSPPSVRCR